MPSLSELVLSHHSLYRLFRRLTGSERVNREFVHTYLRPRPGEAILDIGCGPGDVFALLPQVSYLGIDLSQDYIDFARRRHGSAATFVRGDLNHLDVSRLGTFDAVIALGVIHHLPDEEALTLLTAIRKLLKPQGRFVSYDPGFTTPQHPIARWIHRHDRGRFVRFDHQYETLIAGVFGSYRKHIRTDLCTVPSTVIIFECEAR